MNRNRFGLSALTYSLLLTLSCPAQIVYNPATEWSGTNNPTTDGVWRYGVKDGVTGAFTIFGTHVNTSVGGLILQEWGMNEPIAVPVVSFNANGTTWGGAGPTIVAALELDLHPGGSNQWATLRFTAPFTGSFTFAGTLSGNSNASIGTTTTAFLVHNTTTFLTQQVAGYDSSYNFNQTRTMNAGDTVDVVVDWGYNGNNGADATGLTMTVTAIPEPSTSAALFGLGACLAVAWRRRALALAVWRGRRGEAQLSTEHFR